MKLLAIETATDQCSAALWCDGELLEVSEHAPRQHAARILPMLDALLARAGIARSALDAIAFGRGPGSFTGLRIAAGVTQGIAFALDLPVVPVSSLAALAQGVDAPRVIAALDARLGEVYVGLYERQPDGLVQVVGTDVLAAPADVPVPAGGGWHGAGSGFAQHRDALRLRLGTALADVDADRYPQAGAVARLAVRAFERGEAVDAALALPVYLRDRVTRGPGE